MKKLVILVVALLGLALLSEIAVLALRGEEPKFPIRIVEAPFGLRGLEPGARFGQRTAESHASIRINERGLRADRDYPYEKPAEKRRIVSLGDSITVGYTVEVEQTFSHVLETRLREAGHDVEVLNAGVPGFGTAEQILYLEREISKYDPDLVLVNFYENDIVDNARSGLFKLEGHELVRTADRYVPDTRIANLLGSNPVLRWLDEHSNAFAFARSQTSAWLRARRNRARAEKVTSQAAPVPGDPPPDTRQFTRQDAPRQLTSALFDELHAWTDARGIPLVIQSIPSPAWPSGTLVLQEVFPVEFFDSARPGVHLLLGMDLLPQLVGEKSLYRLRTHHYAPDGHEVMGEALAAMILERRLLDPLDATPASTPSAVSR